MLDIATRTRLDRNSWHKPLVSVIVTHHNYSHHIENALLSVLDQTYENWECLVVDDASESEHQVALEKIVKAIDCDRVRLISLPRNGGQISAFFSGLDATEGQYVCLLDPDDRYSETFLADALDGHFNEAVFCPLLCTEQKLLDEHGLVSGVYGWRNLSMLPRAGNAFVVGDIQPRLLYIPAEENGWHWTSTSAMMFRRSALSYLQPRKQLPYKGSADSYIAQGLHLLGGTLLLTKPLVYRMLHDDNAWIRKDIFSSLHDKKKTYGEERSRECLADVLEAISANGGAALLPRENRTVARRRLSARLSRSFEKRWKKLRTRANM
jgi:glycosyltransferase involved in cell wall biosynthesis